MEMLERVYALNELLNEAIEKVSAVEAYIFVRSKVGFSEPQNNYLQTSFGALVESALINCAALFDRAKYRNEDNCSFEQIIEYYKTLDEKDKKKYQNFVPRIQALCLDFNTFFPKEIRNKLLAHKDLKMIFNHDIEPFKISDLKKVLLDGFKIVSDIMDVTVGAHPKPINFDEIIEKYKESLLAIADSDNNMEEKG